MIAVKAILFDLDDTLYPEREFFCSGFAVVATELESRGIWKSAKIAELLEFIHFGEGREEVFQKASQRLAFPEQWIPELVAIFRAHTPKIVLPQETIQVLTELRGKYRLGCVTDGWADVQKRKIDVLGLAEYLNAIVVSDDLGREFWKPHPLPLYRCCGLLGVRPESSIFVGDNPDRDIKAAKNAGMKSVRLRREGSYFANWESALSDRGDFEIINLVELQNVLEELNASRDRIL